MQFINYYKSPIGEILLACDEIGLTGLWFDNEKYYAQNLDKKHIKKDLPIFDQTKKWLNIYFSGTQPNFLLPIHMIGSPFRITVWKILKNIPYSKTIAYGEIAKIIMKQHNLKTMSAQAIGGAVSHNPISIIIPCHRVIGKNGSLTGYAAGIDRKLKLENVNTKHLFIPKKRPL